MKKAGSVILTILMLTLVGGVMLTITLLSSLAFVAVRKPGVTGLGRGIFEHEAAAEHGSTMEELIWAADDAPYKV